ncbi:MAG: hypothetical protein ACMXYK_05410, partial [Candidatus Woesearchaeota archaeon]
EGKCWTGYAPECENPEEGKSIVCESNRCVFKESVENCEDYSFDDCPDGCYPYMGPSVCSFDESLNMDVCTEDIMMGCFSEEYDPFK